MEWITSLLSSIVIAASSLFGGVQLGAFGDPFLSLQVGTSPTNGYVLQTDGTDSTWVATSTLGIAGGSGGSGAIATSSAETAGQLSYWTSSNATPATLGKVATTTLTATLPLSLSQPIVVIGASASALSLSTSGDWTGTLDGQEGSYYLDLDNQITSVGAADDVPFVGAGGNLVYDTTAFKYSLGAQTLTVPALAISNLGGTGTLYGDVSGNVSAQSGTSGTCVEWGADGSLVDASSATACASAGITAIGPTGQTADGPTVTFATTSDTNIGLTITGSGDTLTFTSDWIGTLANARLTNSTISGKALGTSLDALTATDGSLTFSGSYDGSTARTVGISAIAANSVLGNITGSSAVPSAIATSSLGIAISDTTGTLTVARGGTGQTSFTSSQLLYGNGTNALSSVATGTVSAGNGISISATIYALLNAASIAVDAAANFAWTGVHDFGAAVLEIPNGTGPTTDATGEMAWDTTSGQLRLFNGSANQVLSNGYQYSSFTYATTTTWTGTTTIPLGPAYVGETWTGWKCFTDAGFLAVVFNDGTNNMNYAVSSTTVGTVALSSNNTFTAGEKRYASIGTTTTSSTTKVSCTVSKSITAD